MIQIEEHNKQGKSQREKKRIFMERKPIKRDRDNQRKMKEKLIISVHDREINI